MKKENSWFVMPYNPKKIKLNRKKPIHFPEKFAEKFILEYTKKNNNVFDPFAGYGTTLLAAQKNGRVGIGIEYDKERFNYIKSRIIFPSRIINGDCTKINSMKLPKMDFLLTSPPYMRYFDKENPFTNYTKTGNYKNYLKTIGNVFLKIKRVMKKNSTLVVEASNTFGKNHPMTPLAWDIGKEISKCFFLEKEIIYCHKKESSNIEGDYHSYCLVFRNK